MALPQPPLESGVTALISRVGVRAGRHLLVATGGEKVTATKHFQHFSFFIELMPDKALAWEAETQACFLVLQAISYVIFGLSESFMLGPIFPPLLQQEVSSTDPRSLCLS